MIETDVLIITASTGRFFATVEIDAAELDPAALPDELRGCFKTYLSPDEEREPEESRQEKIVRRQGLMQSADRTSNCTMWFFKNSEGYEFVADQPGSNCFSARNMKVNPNTGLRGFQRPDQP